MAKVMAAATTKVTTMLAATALSTAAAGPGEAIGASTQAPPVELAAHGALCDGRTDDGPAIARAIAAARRAGVAVRVPAAVCAYGDVIELDGVRLTGGGDASVLHALDPRRAAIFMRGEGVELRSLRLTGVPPARREAPWEMTRVTLFGARRFVVDSLRIEGAAAAGIQTAEAASHGRITRNRIRDTLADAIHLTDRASDILVEGNHIDNAGDDGIAVVSYRRDGGFVERITARHNVVTGNRWGRLMSVVGGRAVHFEHNLLQGNRAGLACLYIAQEAGWATHAAVDVVAVHNTIADCGSARTGHGAVTVSGDGQEANTGVTLRANDIRPAAGAAGIRVLGTLNTGIVIEGNRVHGGHPPLSIAGPGATVVPYMPGRAVGRQAPR